MKVWVIIATEDDETFSGYRYVLTVTDSAEKATEYDQAYYSVEEFEVQ